MRAYFFGNMYLSSIQQGIQAGHVIADMFVKYQPDKPNYHPLMEWATDHKTMILLNGGYASTMHEMLGHFCESDNPYPFASFRESSDAAEGLMTSIGIILPALIYETAAKVRSKSNDAANQSVTLYRLKNEGGLLCRTPDTGITHYKEITLWECDLIEQLNKFNLAS